MIIARIVVSENGFLQRVLCCRPLRWIGAISYGLFLWHYPVFRIARRLGASKFGLLTYGMGLTLLVSFVSYCLIERPCLRLKQKIFGAVRA